MLKGIHPVDKSLMDLMSAGVAVLGFFTNVLPSIALLFTIVWTVIRIYETDTVQKLLGKEVKNGKETSSE